LQPKPTPIPLASPLRRSPAPGRRRVFDGALAVLAVLAVLAACEPAREAPDDPTSTGSFLPVEPVESVPPSASSAAPPTARAVIPDANATALLRERRPDALADAPAGLRAAFFAARQAEAADDPRFTLRPASDGWLALPAEGGFGGRFQPDGVALAATAATVRTSGYRCDDRPVRTLGPVEPMRDERRPNRANYVHAGRAALTEWYVHGPHGLEHGYDLNDPTCRATVTFELDLSGLRIDDDDAPADRIRLRADRGDTVLAWRDAAARDAAGKALPVRLAGEDRRLSLQVDVRGARWPIVVDPMLVVDSGGVPRPDEAPGDGAINDKLGTSVSIDGDTAVVGADRDGVAANVSQGSAYVFTRANGTWTQTAKLVAADGAANDNFGRSVSISGDTVVVGAHLEDSGALTDQGAAYVFVRTNGVFAQQQKLLAGSGASGDAFGTSVSIDGDTIAVGVPLDDAGALTNAGSIYVFQRTNGVWAQQALMTASDAGANDNLGTSVAISGGVVVAGAPLDDAGARADQGCAYIYTRAANNTWPQTLKLSAADGAAGDNFGANVAIDGETIAVAAPMDDVGAFTDEGTVSIYLRTAGVWALQAQIVPLDLVNNLRFGISLSFDQNTLGIVATGALAYVFVRDAGGNWLQEARLLVPATAVAVGGDLAVFGFSGENVNGNSSQGSAYFFSRTDGAWSFPTNLTTGDGDQADAFGTSVSISGTTALIGVPGDHVGQATGRGSAYVFVESAGVWTQQARLVANDGTLDDAFGTAVALSGDTAAIGAPADDVVANAGQGSVYVYTRAGAAWSQVQRLNGTGGAAGDAFGQTLALDGDTLLVGAPADDVGAFANQGSAFVFTRNAGVFAQQAQLVAGDGAANDAFGRSVSVSGETALVGAPLDEVGVTTDAGSAYFFLRTAGAWAQQARVNGTGFAANDNFGSAVAVSGDMALIGAPKDDVNGLADQGTAWVFVRSAGTWAVEAPLVAEDGAAGHQFGAAVALDGQTAVIGAPAADSGLGAAYAMVRSDETWCLQTRFDARTRLVGDAFGTAVAVSGMRMLAGAPLRSGVAPYGNPTEGGAFTYALDRNLRPNGDACDCGGECASGFCVDGVCCDGACEGGPCDACNTDAARGQCVPLPVGTECRAATDLCDVAETCNGVAATCPADGVRAQGHECRAVADVCDSAEVCDGTAKACPVDAFKPVNTECRAATDVCDLPEVCTGAARTCPVDRVKAVNTECRGASDLCDAPEVCNGTLKTCPADVLRANGFTCRAAAGTCDVAETCNGVVATCPADTIKAAGAECRAGTGVCDTAEICDGVATACPADAVKAAGTECRATAGDCDTAEACDGTAKTCPVDRFKALGTECRAVADLCDQVETCTGNAAACPADRVKTAGTICRSATDTCDVQEVCNGTLKTCPADGMQPANQQCRAAAGTCDRAENCTGASKVCPPDVLKAAGIECRAASGVCDQAETCDGAVPACPGDAVRPAGAECRAPVGPCDRPETCNGSIKTCPADTLQPAGTECRAAADLCDAPEVCSGAASSCPADVNRPAGTSCRPAAGLCDAPETCTGAAKACPPDAVRPAATVCRAANEPCDVAESCDGVAHDCPADAFQGAGTPCRAATGECDVAEACAGDAAACPADRVRAFGVPCRAASDVCDAAEACDGAAKACPPDAVAPAGTLCRPVAADCDAVENCNGAQKACPADRVAAIGTVCRAAFGPCDAVETCDGTANACPDDGPSPAGTPCDTPSCADGVELPEATCDGGGIDCPPPESVPCDLYVCGESACLETCTESAECASGAFCQDGACIPLLEDGAPCDFPGACVGGLCVDGVCCDSACGGQCEACDEPGSEGICVPVAGEPRHEREPCAGDGSVCGGACDGVTPEGCAYPDAEQPCRAGACEAGIALLPAACAGDGTCPDERFQPCAPFVCGDTACLGDCEVHADCAPGLFCSAGICGEALPDGDPCGEDAECGSGQCVDGVCCASACAGQCEACDVVGFEGQCVPVADGVPHGGRSPCGGIGACAGHCDGLARATCTYPGAATTCQPGRCVDGVASPAAVCDGDGACVEGQGSSCGAYTCGPLGRCLEACVDTVDCANGHFCESGTCVPLRENGAPCARSTECDSQFCVDGVCCDGACGGQCEACNQAGAEGECRPVSGAPLGARSPCATDGSGCGGRCDGVDGETCTYPADETLCRQPRCRDGVATSAATCDGAGACPAEQRVACAPFACGAVACLGDCGSSLDCAADLYCASGVCRPKLAGGEACALNEQCVTGFCVDGVCCDGRCGGQCEACDVTGHQGTCTVVTDEPPHGGRRACTGSGLCRGLCGGERRDACAYPGAEVVCGPGDCVNGVATPESACDGAGACRRGARSNCGAYTCGPVGCLDRCDDAADCAAGFVCLDGACVDPAAPELDAGHPPPPDDAAVGPPPDAAVGPPHDAAVGPRPDAAEPPLADAHVGPAADAALPPLTDATVPPFPDAHVGPAPDAAPVPPDGLATTDGQIAPPADAVFPNADKGRPDAGPSPFDLGPVTPDGLATTDARPGHADLRPVDPDDARPGQLGDTGGDDRPQDALPEGENDADPAGNTGLALGSGCQCRSTNDGAVGARFLGLLLIAGVPIRRRRRGRR
jgi:hypothetical protein